MEKTNDKAPEGAKKGESPEEKNRVETSEADEASAEPDAKIERKTEKKAEKKIASRESEDPDRYLRMAQRTQADFDNYRKRAAREICAARSNGIEDVLCRLFDVADGFERGLANMSDAKDKEGFEIIYGQLIGVLKQFDVMTIDALGKPFDPKYHNAIATCAAESADRIDTVAEVFRNGYVRKDRVLRACLVKVAKESTEKAEKTEKTE